jgi:trk system potassium uptake protein TrkA
VQGEGTNLEVLEQAGVSDSDLLIAITRNDQYNLLTGIYAKNLGVEQVLVQLKDRRLFAPQLQVENLNLDLVLNPFTMTVDRIKEIIKPGASSELEDLLPGNVKVSKFKVSHQSDFVYQTITELELETDSLLLAILRDGRAIIPRGDDKLYPGDILYVISRQTLKGKLGNLIRYKTTKKEKIFLVGGGEINYQLARTCADNARVTLLEQDQDRCKELADELADVLVLKGSGTDLNLLKEEGIAETDTFIAGTEDDEANLLMANLADNLGVNSSVAVVSDISYSSLSDLLALDYIISPALLAIDTILDYLHQGQVNQNAVFAGQVQVNEVEIEAKGRRTIKNLDLPADVLIGLIYRNKEAIIPQGTTRLEQGDKLVIFSLHSKRDLESHF